MAVNEKGGLLPALPLQIVERKTIVESETLMVFGCTGVDADGVRWTWFQKDTFGNTITEYGFAARKVVDVIYRRDGAVVRRDHSVQPVTLFSSMTSFETIVELCERKPTDVEITWTDEQGRQRSWTYSITFNQSFARLYHDSKWDCLMPLDSALPRQLYQRTPDGQKTLQLVDVPMIVKQGDFYEVDQDNRYSGEATLMGCDFLRGQHLYQLADGQGFAIFRDSDVWPFRQ